MEMNDGCFNVKDAAKLDGEGRLKELKPYDLLREVAGISDGMVCIDFGSGTGTFALPLAELVGNQGKVYAVDRSAEMHVHIQAKNPPPNLVLVESDVIQTGLDSQIADVCLLAFILHEVKQPSILMSEAVRLLKPGGKAVVVEWRADSVLRGPPQSKRITRTQIEEIIKQAGLSLLEYHDWSINHYIAIGEHINTLS
jgi:ubiquinone/menaquinone biosynthesis C-methylase UbiE